MEASEYGLTCGTCLVARRLEVVAVAGLLWIPWCVFGAAGFRFFSLNAHGCCKHDKLPRPSFAYKAKKPLHTGVRTGCHYLISPSVCVCLMYVCLYFCMDARNISGLY